MLVATAFHPSSDSVPHTAIQVPSMHTSTDPELRMRFRKSVLFCRRTAPFVQGTIKINVNPLPEYNHDLVSTSYYNNSTYNIARQHHSSDGNNYHDSDKLSGSIRGQNK